MNDSCHLAEVCAIRRLDASDVLALDPKRRGELVEIIFTLRASAMGLPVSKPLSDTEPYDVVVRSGNRLLRIQVKSSFSNHPRGNVISLARGRDVPGHRGYTSDEIDFLVAYIVPHDAWYIIPVAALGQTKSVRLFPTGTRKKGPNRFEQFREAWELLIPDPDPPPK